MINVLFGFPLNKKYETHEYCTQIKPKIVCPKLKQIKFKNHYKQQEVKYAIYSNIECYMKSINKKIGDNTYKISEHVPIAIGSSWNGDYQSYFETEYNFMFNIPMISNKEDKLYHEANNTCHICGKTCIIKVRDHCHQTSKYRGPACNICNLKYKQQTSFL